MGEAHEKGILLVFWTVWNGGKQINEIRERKSKDGVRERERERERESKCWLFIVFLIFVLYLFILRDI